MHKKYVFFEGWMQKLQGFMALEIDESKPTQEHGVKVVDILIGHMYLLCKICWVLVLAPITSRKEEVPMTYTQCTMVL